MYSAKKGIPNDWHFSHLSTYARAGVGIIFTEATAVQENGRITPYCCGLWNDTSQEFEKIAKFIKKMGSIPAIQLAHAGRKASAKQPWKGGTPLILMQRYRKTLEVYCSFPYSVSRGLANTKSHVFLEINN